MSFLVVGFFFALLIMALLPPRPREPRTPGEVRKEVRAEATAFAALNTFFWLLLLGLIIAVVVGYFV